MTDPSGAKRYLRLFEHMGSTRARAMLDKLQVVALTSPDTLRELEAFLDRNFGLESSTASVESRHRTHRPADLFEDDDDDDDTTS
jgi:hypothetical protein